jgi:hypothetical protein
MSTVPLRKAKAGADSFGHTWPEDGSVVGVDYDQALILMAIPDGGFSVAEAQPEAGPVEVVEPDLLPDLSEVAPEPEADASPAPAKRGPRRTTKA